MEEEATGIAEVVAHAGKYLTFNLDGEEYGIGILKIKTIIGMMEITEVPETPDYVKGVINLRGKVIPVVDLRSRFHMPTIDYTDRTCIIVLEVCRGEDTTLTGVVVDAVCEVLNVKSEEIEPPPSFGTSVDTGYILGMAKISGGVKLLLDVDRVLSGTQIEELQRAA